MKYILLSLLLLVGCKTSTEPTDNKTQGGNNIIQIEMGGVFEDHYYKEKLKTEVGTAFIRSGQRFEGSNDREIALYKEFTGCHTEYRNMDEMAFHWQYSCEFVIGEDDKYYYFWNIDFKILKNPTTNTVDNGFIYNYNEADDYWKINKDGRDYYYSSVSKRFETIRFSGNTASGWVYTW